MRGEQTVGKAAPKGGRARRRLLLPVRVCGGECVGDVGGDLGCPPAVRVAGGTVHVSPTPPNTGLISTDEAQLTRHAPRHHVRWEQRGFRSRTVPRPAPPRCRRCWRQRGRHSVDPCPSRSSRRTPRQQSPPGRAPTMAEVMDARQWVSAAAPLYHLPNGEVARSHLVGSRGERALDWPLPGTGACGGDTSDSGCTAWQAYA
eukprot:COSAG01_NODE_8285_length_2844_cov_2.650273_2_plen_202_part_00